MGLAHSSSMPRIARLTYAGAHYHVLSRGLERRNIYNTQRDKIRFLEFLEESVSQFQVKVLSYCLMNNHYHLLLQSLHDNLSLAMKYINGSYATYFNAKYKRVGPLFSARFKSILVEEDPYILELSRYIHLNPVRARIADKPEDFRWSSYREYLGYRITKWIDIDWLLRMFGSNKSEAMHRYNDFVEKGMGKDKKDPLKEIIGGMLLGQKSGVENLIRKYSAEGKMDTVQIIKSKLIEPPSFKEIDDLVEQGIEASEKDKRKVKIFLSYKYAKKPLRVLGEYYGGIQRSSIKMSISRFIFNLYKNNKLRCALEKIEKVLKEKSEQ